MSKLLIVCHCPSENTERLRDAVVRGASSAEIPSVSVRSLGAFDARAEDVLGADAVILGTTENFGYMNGALKDFFERVYYPCLDRSEGMPWAMFVKAGNDGTGAQSSIRRIVQGLRWREVLEPAVCVGAPQTRDVACFEELGMSMAAGLEAGIF